MPSAKPAVGRRSPLERDCHQLGYRSWRGGLRVDVAVVRLRGGRAGVVCIGAELLMSDEPDDLPRYMRVVAAVLEGNGKWSRKHVAALLLEAAVEIDRQAAEIAELKRRTG